jgi:hypothetical protein
MKIYFEVDLGGPGITPEVEVRHARLVRISEVEFHASLRARIGDFLATWPDGWQTGRVIAQAVRGAPPEIYKELALMTRDGLVLRRPRTGVRGGGFEYMRVGVVR